MFINSITKTLFGPKNLDGTWPVGVSMVGPKGDQGLTGLTGATGPQGPSGGSGPAGPAGTNGINATIAITELFVCDGPDAGTVANEKCKIGMTGPGGGLIFFVDYNDEYAEFNYLEVAPISCEGSRKRWSSVAPTAIPAVSGWAARAVGSGKANTAAILAVLTPDGAPAAAYANASTCGGKSDWFLGSIGEMNLVYKNLLGRGDFENQDYWTSCEYDSDYAWYNQLASINMFAEFFLKDLTSSVRPIRSF
jgi:hypothetical protein